MNKAYGRDKKVIFYLFFHWLFCKIGLKILWDLKNHTGTGFHMGQILWDFILTGQAEMYNYNTVYYIYPKYSETWISSQYLSQNLNCL